MSVKYRRLINGDYSFGRNNGDFLTGIDAVSQAIRTRLLLLKGEWWEDTEQGLPLFQSILGQYETQPIDLLVQDTYKNRTYSVSCTVDTKYGQAYLEVTL